MKKVVLFAIAILILGSGFVANAQIMEEDPASSGLDRFYDEPENNRYKPFEFPYIRKDDITWQWRVWRTIDFKLKMNQIFYYPITPENGRLNLYTALENAINEGKIRIYKDENFKEEITDWNAYKSNLVPPKVTTIFETDIDGMEYEKETLVQGTLPPEDIKKLRIKEDWFIDKARTVQDVRIAGFALIYDQIKEEGSAPIPMPLFWVRYNDPEVRDLLANTEVYNPRNDIERRSYDDIFVKRYFDSYVMQETNVYNRRIDQYAVGEEALAESERIADMIFEKEDDMWEY